MNAREKICAVLASATFEHCRKVKAAGREQPAVPERHVFPNKATSSRLSSLPLHLPRGLQQRTKQDSSLSLLNVTLRLSGVGVLCVPELTSGSARSYASMLTFRSVGFEAGSCL